MKEIAGLTGLEELILDDLPIGDAGAKELAKLPLTQLSLKGSAITDAGLKELAKIKTLTKINITGCKMIKKSSPITLKTLFPKATIEGP